MDTFPIAPDVRYDYASRFGAGVKHFGTDIFAPRGAAVVAVEGGEAHADIDPLGGIVVYLDGASGTRYYYAHLDSVVDPLDPDEPFVKVVAEPGDVLGFVGTTGNALGKQPHLHFQLAPRGSKAVDPFPELVKVDPKRQPGAPSSGPSSGETALGVGSAFALLMLWALARMVD